FSMRKSNVKIPIYVDLFDYMLKKGVQKDEGYLSALAGVKAKIRLDNIKSQLYKNLVKSLFLTSTNNEKTRELSLCQFELQLLYQKGLYNHCADRLKYISRKARTNENWITILHCLEIESLLGEEVANRSLGEIHNEREWAIRCLQLELNYRTLYESFDRHFKQIGTPRSYQDLEFYTDIHENDLIRNESLATSRICKMYRLLLLNSYSQINHDEAEAIDYSLKLKQLFESSPRLSEKHNDLALQASLNLIQNYSKSNEMLMASKASVEFGLYIDQLKKSDLKLEFMLRNQLAAFRIQIKSGEYRSLYNGRNELDELLAKSKKMSSDYWYDLYFFIAYSCFVHGDYRAAAVYLNKILNQSFRRLGPEIALHTRLLLLITYFEQNEERLIESQLRNTFAFLHRQKGLRKFEKSILQIIRNAARLSLTDKKALREMFVDGQRRLERVFSDPFEQGALEYFDYPAYFESKVNQRSFVKPS
ncbi:hypothetical protein JYT72_02505, partial [Crocinitomix catalasitica]|nr:hypothetical protein [Crocinitomix catalasitica]